MMPLNKVYLELTNRCNLDCKICYRKTWTDKPAHMDTSLFYKICNEIKQIKSIDTIVLGGIGEPTYSPLIKEAIDQFKNYKLILTTNGVDMNEDVMVLLVKHMDIVMISIDGMDETYNYIRGVGIKKVLNTITSLQRIKGQLRIDRLNIGMQFVINKDNIKELISIIDLARKLSISTIQLSHLLPQCEENKVKILYTRYENEKLQKIYKEALKYSFPKGIKLIMPNYQLKTER